MNESGIDVKKGESCSKTAYGYAKKTFLNNKFAKIKEIDFGFSNLIEINDFKIGISSDGIGTKIEIAERMNKYDTLGFDLIAMVCDDLISNGFIPISISNILDVDYLDEFIVNDLFLGLYNAVNEINISISGGEIAELGNRISGYGDKMHFNWCATGMGILHKSLNNPIDGKNIKPNDIIMSLQSNNFRSNGFSLIRKILFEKFGNNWHNEKYNEKTYGELLLNPSILYSNIIKEILDNNVLISGIAHITGGGIFDNLLRILKINSLGANLNNVLTPTDFMLHIQNLGNIDNYKAYQLWNMNNGMLFIIDKADLNKTVEILNKNKTGFSIVGVITNERTVSIKTKNELLKYYY